MSFGGKLNSLRALAFLLVGGSLAIFALLFFVIFSLTMPRMLLESETRYLTKQLDVVSGLVDSAMRTTYALTEDTALWEETVRYAERRNPDYFKNNWPDTSLLESFRLNFIVIKNVKGETVYTEFRDHAGGGLISAPQGFTASLNDIALKILGRYENGTLPPSSDEDLGMGGIFFHNGRPYGLAALPILPSRDSDRPAGVLIMGNIFDNAYFRSLTHFNSSSFDIVPAPEQESLLSPIHRLSDDTVSTVVPLRDIAGNPLFLRMSDRRAIYQEGQETLHWATFLFFLSMLMFAAILYFILTRLVLRPLERLSADIGTVAFNGRLQPDKYSDTREFVTLTGAINAMVERLNQSKISTDVLKRILNGIDAYLYVTDPATGRILFINDKMAKHYRIQDQVIDQSSWHELHSDFSRASGFNADEVLAKNPDNVVVWEDFSPLTGRYYRKADCMIEWTNGAKAHLQHGIDITETTEAKATLKRRLEQQKLMSAISQSFISTGDVPTLINNALCMTGSFMNISKIVLSRFEAAENRLVHAYEWRNENQTVLRSEDGSHPFPAGDPVYEALVRNGDSYLSYDDIAGKAEFGAMTALGIRAFIAVPIRVSGTFWGLLAVDDCTGPRPWSESDIQLLKLIGNVISGVLTRRRMEEKLVRMSSIVDSSPQFIAYINEEGAFEDYNPGTLAMLGYTAKELEKDGIAAFLDEEDCALIRDDIIPCTTRQGRAECELPVRRKDGQQRILYFSFFRTAFKTGGIGLIASDMTENRQLQRALVEAKEQAEKSSQAKGQFLSRMSHEMRTPMNAIIGMTTIARSASDLERKEYCLDKIDEASKHLLGVINDILDMSKIEANRFELIPTAFNFEKMLMRVISVVAFRADEKDQNLIVNVDTAFPPVIVADEQRLAQVVTNLLSNAIKFTAERGDIVLSAHATDETEESCTLRIAVTDNGIGIAPDQRERLFGSFEQVDGSISRKFGGTGLGLAISKSITEMMGGAIGVESQLGEGSTFTLAIPVRKEDAPDAPEDRLDEGEIAPRVLVVAGSQTVRNYFLSIAPTLGFDGTTAPDGETALSLAETTPPPFDVAFVDWKLPDMDGIELTRRLKETSPSLRVVLMISATAWIDVEAEARKAGVVAYTSKPLFTSLVANGIREVLGAPCCEEPDDSPRPGDAYRFAGYRVLLAEDMDVNCEIVMALLEDTGLTIDCAENGLQAYRMFADDPDLYDLIFMDIHMPEVDGYEATRRIRALDAPEAKTVPIVAMTANVFQEDVDRCLAVGMNDHIGKPINLDDILRKLERYLPSIL